MLQDRGKTRARSMQDMSLVLANKARDTRSVSFNGVVAMVDAALHLNSVSADRRNELFVAVNENKIDVLRYTNLFKICQFFHIFKSKLIFCKLVSMHRKHASSGSVNLKSALQATIEKVSVGSDSQNAAVLSCVTRVCRSAGKILRVTAEWRMSACRTMSR